VAELDNWPVVTDDDGTKTSGTPFDAAYNDAAKAAIEDDIYSSSNPTVRTADIIDEVVAARGSAVSLVERLNATTDSDGSFLNGIVQRLHTDLTANQNVNTGLTDLTQYSLPADTLAVNGQVIRVTAFGIFGANGDTKIVRFEFGATSIIFASTASNGGHWRMVVEIYRVDGTNQLLNGQLLDNNDGVLGVVSGNPQPTETLSGAVILGVAAQGASSGDIIQNALMVEFLN
jgi:hypothetical protein